MRSYDKEFKEETVKLAKEVGAVKAAQTLGISKNTFYTWVSKEKKNTEFGVSIGKSSMRSAETIRLLKENAELKKANEILKAALGFAPQGWAMACQRPLLIMVRMKWESTNFHQL